MDQNFAMFAPVFADFRKGMVRLGQVAVVGRTAIFRMQGKPKKVVLNAYKEIFER